jgi:hypothetical protein
MVISKRVFTLLVVLAAAGVGAVMYAALLATGMQGNASTADSVPVASQPVRVSLDASDLEGLCQPVVIDGDSSVEQSTESGDFATNSGTIAGSQFNDGGFGDIGQQWWQTVVNAPVTNVHVSGSGNTTTVGVDASTTAPTSEVTDSGVSSKPKPKPTTSTTTPTTAPEDVGTEETDTPPEG